MTLNRRGFLLSTSMLSVAPLLTPQPTAAQTAAQPSVTLPRTQAPFDGTIGTTYKESKPDFPKPVAAPPQAPNVVLILLDDIGFGQPGTFGGSVPTPAFDALAQGGLRYNQFHSTALCSPTRSALLSGRNHHSVGMGTITELATGFPGYTSIIPKSAGSIAEVVRQNGFNTAAFGKWHQTPDFETGPTGPFDRWPTGQGFEHFYGFLGGETSQWTPQLYENTTPAEPYATPVEGYHLTTDITDRAIAWMRLQTSSAPSKPFFLYFATGAVHAPHHVPEEWSDRFRGQFDHGWDREREIVHQRQLDIGVVPQDTQLTPRPAEIPSWESRSPDQKRLFARMQEVFAGFVAHTDHEVSRLLAALDETGQGDNTLVILIVGDNGPSAEGTLQGTLNNMATQQGVEDDFQHMLDHIDEIGGPLHENHYPVGWAWAGSAPFQWMKQVASHFGGTRNGMVVSWPKRIVDHGGLRRQFHHVIDIAPTIYEAAGIEVPSTVNGVAQQPVEGISIAYTFDKTNADAPSQRTTQYFEMFGNRAIYRDGWVAAARHGRLPWLTVGSVDFSQDTWELYNITEDFSQATDLAARYPDKLKELQALFLDEARRYNVLPLDDHFAERADPSSRPSTIFGRSAFTYFPGAVRIPEGSAPIEKAGSHRIEADLVMPAAGAEGVIVTSGGTSGGYALFVKDGKLAYVYNYFGREQTTLTSSDELPRGTDVKVSFEFHADGPAPGAPGIGQLFIDGRKVAEARIAHRVPYRNSATETFDVGRDTGTAVIHGLYEVPFAFSGGLKRLDFNYLSAIGASGIGPDAGGDEGNGGT